MRPLKLSLVPVVAIGAMLAAPLASCKKDAVMPPPANSVSLNFDSMGMHTTNVVTTTNLGLLNITGVFNDHTMVWLAVPNPQVGSFAISNGGGGASFDDGSSDEYLANSGSINITSMSGDTVRGTFRLHCMELASGQTCEIIDGTFQVVAPGE